MHLRSYSAAGLPVDTREHTWYLEGERLSFYTSPTRCADVRRLYSSIYLPERRNRRSVTLFLLPRVNASGLFRAMTNLNVLGTDTYVNK